MADTNEPLKSIGVPFYTDPALVLPEILEQLDRIRAGIVDGRYTVQSLEHDTPVMEIPMFNPGEIFGLRGLQHTGEHIITLRLFERLCSEPK